MIPSLIERYLSRESIEPAALEAALHQIMAGEVPEVQTAGLLVALRTREPDAPTLAACARAMRAHRLAVHVEVQPLIDTCGTGGDRAGTFNISTAAALIVAGAGGAVAKHGNRSVSSKSGSADVLEKAGCALDIGPRAAHTLLDATGFAFLFAPYFHPAMSNVGPVRRALGIRTLFNLLGPLANPALAGRQLLGVYHPDLTAVMAEALLELGTEGALVVHCAGLDEIGLHDVTRGHRVREGRVEPFSLDPAELGLTAAPIDALAGGDPEQSVGLLLAALRGEPGPRSDVVAVNAGAALWVAGLVKDLSEGLERAREVQRQGHALRVLERYAESSQRASVKREAAGESD